MSEDEANNGNKIEKLRRILTEHYPDLELPTGFDDFLLRCLRVRKFDIARSAKLIYNYFKLLGELSDMHEYLLPSQYGSLYNTFATSVLKNRDAEGRVVILTRYELVSPSIYSFDQALSATLLLLDQVVMASAETQKSGVVFVCDWKGYSLAHFRQTSPSRLKTAAKLFQDAFPAKFKAFHFIRNPFLVGCLFAIVKPFLRNKIRNRIYFHGHDMTSFHSHVPENILPEFLGGKLQNDAYADIDLTSTLMTKDTYYKDLLAHSHRSS